MLSLRPTQFRFHSIKGEKHQTCTSHFQHIHPAANGDPGLWLRIDKTTDGMYYSMCVRTYALHMICFTNIMWEFSDSLKFWDPFQDKDLTDGRARGIPLWKQPFPCLALQSTHFMNVASIQCKT